MGFRGQELSWSSTFWNAEDLDYVLKATPEIASTERNILAQGEAVVRIIRHAALGYGFSYDPLMRFIHTADWHLGRLFHGVHLTSDQAYILEQLLAVVRESKAEALLISGDVYDRAVPPPEAVTLLDDVLSRAVLGLRIPVILIAGNHDSPDRLGFGSQLLSAQGLQVRASLEKTQACIVLHDQYGPVNLFCLPYAEPALVRQTMEDDNIQDCETAMQALIRLIPQSGRRSILLAHAFVAGGLASESERPLSVGGAGTVSAAHFAPFHYAALGHLHRAQAVEMESIQYAGSLLKYSFSEVDHVKSVSLVEMDAQGNCRLERVPLAPQRDVRCIEGELNALVQWPDSRLSREDYLLVRLTDVGAILDPMGKLRQVYPNVLHLERQNLRPGSGLAREHADHRRMTETELFAGFYAEVTGTALTPEQISAFDTVVETQRQGDREAQA